MPKIPEKTITQNAQDKMEEMSGLTGQELIDFFWRETRQFWLGKWWVYNKAKMKTGETLTYTELDLAPELEDN